jgi:hypothetical protein
MLTGPVNMYIYVTHPVNPNVRSARRRLMLILERKRNRTAVIPQRGDLDGIAEILQTRDEAADLYGFGPAVEVEVDPASETTGAGLLVGSAAAPTS